MFLYDITKSYEENLAFGPYFSGKYPKLKLKKPGYSFLGHKIGSPLGIASCPLSANSRFIGILAHFGYDIITYKSVRSREWHGQPFPHWLYVNAKKQLSSYPNSTSLKASMLPLRNADVTMVNSFGIHSLQPQYWQEDVDLAVHKLLRGQVLVLSLMFTPYKGEDIVTDAKRVSRLAIETSAPIIELNLSHPNSGDKSLFYKDVETTIRICRAARSVITDRPILAKIGYFPDEDALEFFLQKTKGVIDGVSSTNAYALTITSPKGKGEAFPGRATGGVSGAAIRELSLAQAKKLVFLRNKLKLKKFVIVGIGGVTKPSHFDAYLKLGVDVVESAAGAWADPLLAVKYKRSYKTK